MMTFAFLHTRIRVFGAMAALAMLVAACQVARPDDKADYLTACSQYVNPMIGTGGHGHTFPGATLPFGMVQLSPDTRREGWDGCGGYHNDDRRINGFAHTHLSGTGVSDYGDILLMPRSYRPAFEDKLDKQGKSLDPGAFDKQDESAGAGWYKVKLKQDGTMIALTATTHCGFHRYIFQHESEHQVSLDLAYRDPILATEVWVTSDNRVEGYRFSSAWAKHQKLFFSIQFSQPITSQRWQDAPFDLHKDQHYAQRSDKIIFSFEDTASDTLLVKVGISAVSVEGARKNLEAEIPKWDFEGTQQAASLAWDQQLSKIQIAGGTAAQQRIFYSALYHTSIVPNLFSDVDGQYRGMDDQVHSSTDQQYTVFSLWDTYRAAHPLYTLIEQKRSMAFIRSFLRMYQEGGRLPVWELAGNETDCMIGYHSVSVIADAYMKGLRDFDAELALEAMVASADADRFGLSYYKSQGHIGAGDEAESVSKTLEYAYDDWCIGTFAAALGKDSIANRFFQRAQYYKNLYDPETGFFRAKMNGSWQAPFDPREVNFNFTEANAWQYSLAVQQDIEGLIALKGGRKGLEAHLDRLFTADQSTTGREQADITGLIGQYAHGNEPSHHMAWLYNFTDAPHKTQMYVRPILQDMYHDAADGLSGNEDCGQMSAWYVMSAMGLYAVTPGRPEYLLSAPLFPHLRIQLENGKSFEIKAVGVDQGLHYIQSAKLNGLPLHSLVISQEAIQAGGVLEYTMGETPYDQWAGDYPQRPSSRIDAPKIATVPYFITRAQTFTDTLMLRMASVEPNVQIHYTLDGSTPDRHSPVYARPLMLSKNTVLQAITLNAEGQQSPAARGEFYKIDPNRKLQLLTKYENQYAAGGDLALIDGLKGSPNFRTGRWQGYQGDLECIVDLGKTQAIKTVKVGFLQDINSWIWMPRQVEFAFSQDGKSFQDGQLIPSKTADNLEGAVLDNYVVQLKPNAAFRYISIKASNYGLCPPWHLGAGGRAWIFADEIVVE